ncbi:hypothetical protein EVAR_12850_1 [Eumeta japonica]|uniref:Uncharacterized protein n=1 Tax=Eumeta variegata TaxID=151549 RepID=A0A4C1UBR6_EUMVA|nr:hypothetical protein EVAR_12850_1 [Eumeta japonica]
MRSLLVRRCVESEYNTNHRARNLQKQRYKTNYEFSNLTSWTADREEPSPGDLYSAPRTGTSGAQINYQSCTPTSACLPIRLCPPLEPSCP